MPVLVKWDLNWADEFDMTGFFILSDENYAEMDTAIDNLNYPVEMSFGTNEEYLFESANELRAGISTEQLTDSEAVKFKRLFGDSFYSDDYGFGWTPVPYLLAH